MGALLDHCSSMTFSVQVDDRPSTHAAAWTSLRNVQPADLPHMFYLHKVVYFLSHKLLIFQFKLLSFGELEKVERKRETYIDSSSECLNAAKRRVRSSSIVLCIAHFLRYS